MDDVGGYMWWYNSALYLVNFTESSFTKLILLRKVICG
jgi:hypothetical protein